MRGRETSTSCFPYAPQTGIGPTNILCMGRHSNQLIRWPGRGGVLKHGIASIYTFLGASGIVSCHTRGCPQWLSLQRPDNTAPFVSPHHHCCSLGRHLTMLPASSLAIRTSGAPALDHCFPLVPSLPHPLGTSIDVG